jgi:hypothetical protein
VDACHIVLRAEVVDGTAVCDSNSRNDRWTRSSLA